MRGRSSSYLVQASDGQFYVAKFRDNPKGTRTLINELLGSLILPWLGLPVTAGVILQLDQDALVDGTWPVLGDSVQGLKAKAGFHFGSGFPVDPNVSAVYDYLPRGLYPSVSNLDDFSYALLTDLWLGRSEPRQAVFHREGERRFKATLIDNSMLFGGSVWEFGANPGNAWYFDHAVYGNRAKCAPHIEKIAQVGGLLGRYHTEILKLIPEEWLEEDQSALNRLLNQTAERARMFAPEIEEADLIDRHSAIYEQPSWFHRNAGPAIGVRAEHERSLPPRKPVQSELGLGGESNEDASLLASAGMVAAS